MQPKVKHETSLDKVRPRQGPGRSKSDQALAGGTAQDIPGASPAGFPSGVDRRRDCRHRRRTGLPHNPVTVPVLGRDGEPFMPTCAYRARRWVKASKAHTYANLLCDAVDWVKDALGVTAGRPENLRLIHCRPLPFRRRALHLQNPAKGGVRRSHGGTLSMGFKRGSLVKHPRHGLCTVGGTMGGKISLHRLSGKRLCQNAKPKDLRRLKRTSLVFQPVTKDNPPTPA